MFFLCLVVKWNVLPTLKCVRRGRADIETKCNIVSKREYLGNCAKHYNRKMYLTLESDKLFLLLKTTT